MPAVPFCRRDPPWRRRRPASRRKPAATPARSASTRFWLTFHLPVSRAIGISMPTIPLICAAVKAGGASATAQGASRPASRIRVRSSDLPAQPSLVLDDARAAPCLHGGRRFQVGTTFPVSRFVAVPGGRDVAVGALEHDEAFVRARRGRASAGWRGSRWARSVPASPASRSRRNGDRVGHQPAGTRAHEEAERTGADEGGLGFEIVAPEMGRLVHG